jgi:hypothetical protein
MQASFSQVFLPPCPWDSIFQDFIIELPVSDRWLSVWVIVDRFMKMAHFIPLKDGEKKATDLVKIFLKV